jgi:hypothetical protein
MKTRISTSKCQNLPYTSARSASAASILVLTRRCPSLVATRSAFNAWRASTSSHQLCAPTTRSRIDSLPQPTSPRISTFSICWGRKLSLIRFRQIRERSRLLDVRPIGDSPVTFFCLACQMFTCSECIGEKHLYEFGSDINHNLITALQKQLCKGITMSSMPRHWNARRLSERRLFHTKIT